MERTLRQNSWHSLHLSAYILAFLETWCLSLADLAAVTWRDREQKRNYDQQYWQRLKADPERYKRRIAAIIERRKLRSRRKTEHPPQWHSFARSPSFRSPRASGQQNRMAASSSAFVRSFLPSFTDFIHQNNSTSATVTGSVPLLPSFRALDISGKQRTYTVQHCVCLCVCVCVWRCVWFNNRRIYSFKLMQPMEQRNIFVVLYDYG